MYVMYKIQKTRKKWLFMVSYLFFLRRLRKFGPRQDP